MSRMKITPIKKPVHETVADFRWQEFKIVFNCPECDHQRIVYYFEDMANEGKWKIRKMKVTNEGDRRFSHRGGNGIGMNLTPPSAGVPNRLRDAFGAIGDVNDNPET